MAIRMGCQVEQIEFHLHVKQFELDVAYVCQTFAVNMSPGRFKHIRSHALCVWENILVFTGQFIAVRFVDSTDPQTILTKTRNVSHSYGTKPCCFRVVRLVLCKILIYVYSLFSIFKMQ